VAPCDDKRQCFVRRRGGCGATRGKSTNSQVKQGKWEVETQGVGGQEMEEDETGGGLASQH